MPRLFAREQLGAHNRGQLPRRPVKWNDAEVGSFSE
jgi:hypothetical protein